jgi:hypothetical protein
MPSGNPGDSQGRQMVYFQTGNPTLGKFGKVLQWKIWCTLCTFGLFYDHLVYFVTFVVIWYIFWYVVPRKIWQTWRQGDRRLRIYFLRNYFKFKSIDGQ